MKFAELLNEIPRIAAQWHTDALLQNTQRNNPTAARSIRELRPAPQTPVLIISAGPSLHRENILQRIYRRFDGIIVAVDGAYVACLKAGCVPEYVLTLDPHPTRMVRWFGDPDFAQNSAQDDYFARQDLDVAFRENATQANEQNIALVNANAHKSRFIVGSSAPENVVRRLREASAPMYWFCPLVDAPTEGSLTQRMMGARRLPAMNTGGTVGIAAWVFAHSVLQAQNVGCVGMDFGYYMDTPFSQTQCYNMVKEYGEPMSEFFPHYTGYWGEFYTDPTYWYYRQNFLDLLEANKARVLNCSGAGLLFGRGVGCMALEQFLAYIA